MANLSRDGARIDGEMSSRKLAVLIDADNAKASVIEAVLTEIAGFGEATVKRIYGDFTSNASASWKKVLQRLAIKPVQQFAYTSGKNSTDITLIIDAMDLLYTRRFDGFCLVSSDSDFTGLALRIREEGLTVYGFGEEKTPEAFRSACHRFVYTEVLSPKATASVDETPAPPASSSRRRKSRSGASAPAPSVAPAPSALPRVEAPVLEDEDEEEPEEVLPSLAPRVLMLPIDLIRQALEQASDESGWASLGALGSQLNNLKPDFDARRYGYKKLSELIQARTDIFEIAERSAPGAVGRVLAIRAR